MTDPKLPFEIGPKRRRPMPGWLWTLKGYAVAAGAPALLLIAIAVACVGQLKGWW